MEETQIALFEEWWTLIQPRLRLTVARFTGSGASDTVQDVAVLALRRWNRFASYEDFARWCQIRARWLALDELAQSRRHPHEPIESVEAQLLAEENSPMPEILEWVEKLPERQRAVVLYKLMGYRTDEIARTMSITDGAVRSHWRFAQQSLAKQVD